MPPVHRDTDLRFCGASTIALLQQTVFVNNKLAAVVGDISTHPVSLGSLASGLSGLGGLSGIAGLGSLTGLAGNLSGLSGLSSLGNLANISSLAGGISGLTNMLGGMGISMPSMISSMSGLGMNIGNVGDIAGIASSIGGLSGISMPSGVGDVSGIAAGLSGPGDIAGITSALSGFGVSNIAGVGNIASIAGNLSSLGDVSSIATSISGLGSLSGIAGALGGNLGNLSSLSGLAGIAGIGNMGNFLGAAQGMMGLGGNLGNLTNMMSSLGGLMGGGGLGQLISASPGTVLAQNIPMIASLMDQSAPDIIGIITHITNFPTPAKGSTDTFLYGGPGTFAGGLGIMNMLGGGGFGSLLNGEMVSMAGNVIGMVQNFTSLGGGQGLATISGVNGGLLQTIPSIGSQVVGGTSGNSITFYTIEGTESGTGVANGTVVALGDSITQLYPWVEESLGPLNYNVVRYSKNGRFIQDGLKDWYGNSLTATNFQNVDAVTIYLGINDYQLNTPLGNISDSSSTASFTGYAKNIIENIQSWNANTKIIFNSLVLTTSGATPGYPNANGTFTLGINGLGLTQDNYNNRISTLCSNYNILFNDMRNNSGITGETFNETIGPDGETYGGSANPYTGTVSITAGSKTVTGVGTVFTSQTYVGDYIVFDNVTVGTVYSIQSDTSLTLEENSAATHTGPFWKLDTFQGDGLHPNLTGYNYMMTSLRLFFIDNVT